VIEVYTSPTPNGIKVPIALEELELPYQLHRVDLSRGGAAVPELVGINPNAKIPAIIDRSRDGQAVPVFESGAILLHLAELKTGLLPDAGEARAAMLSWLFLQVAGLGPNFGNAGYFLRNDPSNRTAIERFGGEAKRHLDVVNQRLSGHEWLNGQSYSIADIAHFGWVRMANYAGLNLRDFPAAGDWVSRIAARPAVQRALARCNA
jgi:GST-like protein